LVKINKIYYSANIYTIKTFSAQVQKLELPNLPFFDVVVAQMSSWRGGWSRVVGGSPAHSWDTCNIFIYQTT
jgi:hypothetical protein